MAGGWRDGRVEADSLEGGRGCADGGCVVLYSCTFCRSKFIEGDAAYFFALFYLDLCDWFLRL